MQQKSSFEFISLQELDYTENQVSSAPVHKRRKIIASLCNRVVNYKPIFH